MNVRRALLGAGLLAGAACGGAPPRVSPAPAVPSQQAPVRSPPPPPVSSPCVITGPTSGTDTVFVAVPAPLHPITADPPESEGDHLVFRQLYETLVRLDCEGQPRQALERSWGSEAMGSVWTFELASGRTFADGSPIDAAAAAAGWERRAGTGRGAALPRVATVEVAGAWVVKLRFEAPRENAIRLMSDWRFAIMGRAGPGGAPAASGPFVAARADVASDGTIAALVLTPKDAARGPVLKFVAVPAGTDLRDALDRGIGVVGLGRIDVMTSRDPEVLAYAARRGDYHSLPLPWDRTYVLVGGGAAPDAATAEPLPTGADRDALARDAVRSDARGAVPPFWWLQDSGCAAMPPPPLGRVRREVGYAAGDAIGRELAERIVALAELPSRPGWIPSSLAADARAPLRVSPLPADSVDDAVAAGRVAAAVVARRREEPAGCTGGARVARFRVEVPLVDSRAHVVFRTSGFGFSIEGDGTIRFTPGKAP